MAYIETVQPDRAVDAVREQYERDRERLGYVPNYSRLFSLRPPVYATWRRLIGAISSPMDPRRYELVTLAAARALRTSYCMLAHGTVLRDRFYPPEVVQAIARDERGAGLDPVDLAVMALAAKVARDATSVTREDVEALRALGLADAEILDVVLAAAARSFFGKVLDALGAEPDPVYLELEPGLRDALTVGRPLAGAARPLAGGRALAGGGGDETADGRGPGAA